jgi:transcriptional regulator with XRE-family HTH domain
MRGRFFGDRVRNRRCALRLSLSELARRIGVKPQTLHSVERNTTTQMLPANLFRLADALMVDVHELVLGQLPRARRGRTDFKPWATLEIERFEVLAGPDTQNVTMGEAE